MAVLEETCEARPGDVSALIAARTTGRSLADLRRGQGAVVCAISDSCDPDCARRLVDLGFAPGAQVEFIRRTPLRDPTIFRVCDYEVALRADLSRMVLLDATP